MEKSLSTKEPSLNKAIHLYRTAALDQQLGDRSPKLFSEATIRNLWAQFKLSAPIWAAINLNATYRFCEPQRELQSKENLVETLKYAAGLYKFGSNFVAARQHNRKPLLDPGICIFGDYFLSEAKYIQSSQKPDILVRLLEDYKAPKSLV